MGRFIRLERIVERTKESYYDTLYQSSQNWHQGQHSLLPWYSYDVMLSGKKYDRDLINMIINGDCDHVYGLQAIRYVILHPPLRRLNLDMGRFLQAVHGLESILKTRHIQLVCDVLGI